MTSLSVPAEEALERVCAYSACALVGRPLEGEASAAALTRERLLSLCRVTSERVESVQMGRAWGALLDLGRCSADEAREVCVDLAARLKRAGFEARIGVGPTLTLARLAALICAPSAAPETVSLVSPAARATFLQALPVDLLARLEPAVITPEVVTRLRQYGLRTLGQVARLGERDPQLVRRQFGRAGTALAVLACGDDPRALHVTSAPERIAVRRRFSPAATADQVFAAASALAGRLAQRLDARSKQGRSLQAHIVWDSGAEVQMIRRLARPFHQPSELAQAAHALLAAHLTPAAGSASHALVTSLTLTLGDLSIRLSARPVALLPLTPISAERSVTRERIERLTLEVAEPLARRYGSPALYRLDACQPDAILPEDRLRLVSLNSASGDQRIRSRPAQRPRAADKALETLQAIPPQPHWW